MNRGKENRCCEEPEKYEPEEMESKPHPKPCEITETILKCGTVTGSAPLTCNPGDGGGPCGSQPVVQASVALDTNGLHEPTVKIDFSSLISFKTCDENYFLHLGFRLTKICGGFPIHLGTWTFEKSYNEFHGGCVMQDPLLPPPPSGSAQETESFCFSWCECEDCPGCCRYIVELIDQRCYNIIYAAVSNVSLTALVVGEKKSH